MNEEGESVGIVAPQRAIFDSPFQFRSGAEIPRWEIVYETYGELNSRADNAILICHALSGNHHAAGIYQDSPKSEGWWDSIIGPGKPIDTREFFVLSPNNLGGCHGSTGPSSADPARGIPYGSRFPMVTVEDWVESQRLLADRLGIAQFAAVVGGSLGGMQAMQWAIAHPQRLRHAVVIAAAAKLTAQNIAFNDIARQAIMRDPDFCGGDFYQNESKPRRGLGIARMLGHVTYLSDDALAAKFGRDRRAPAKRFDHETEFEVESYLRHQGRKFSGAFDANTYLLMTRALDYFDPAHEWEGDLERALASVRAGFLIVSFTSDWRFPSSRSREIARALLNNRARVCFAEINSAGGHDSFLLPGEQYHRVVRAYLQNRARGGGGGGIMTPSSSQRFDFPHIARWINEGATVLDLGCGDGALLSYLRERKGARGVGVDIADSHIVECIARGLDVIQGDVEQGLSIFSANQFDAVVLSQTLQAVMRPDRLLSEMMRVGRRAVVSFPNFGCWNLRLQLLTGTMPVSSYLPYEWHNTPNVRFCTISDFERFCTDANARILERVFLKGGKQAQFSPNLFADLAIYLLDGGK